MIDNKDKRGPINNKHVYAQSYSFLASSQLLGKVLPFGSINLLSFCKRSPNKALFAIYYACRLRRNKVVVNQDKRSPINDKHVYVPQPLFIAIIVLAIVFL